MKFSLLIIGSIVLSAGMTSAEITWANGVNKAGGWYDADKPSENIDNNYSCYAASAANLIAWWQQQSNLSVNDNEPQEIDKIWDKYQEECDTEKGGDPRAAINWWISGVYLPANEEEANRSIFEWPPDSSITLQPHKGYYFDEYGLTKKQLNDFIGYEDPGVQQDGFFRDMLKAGMGISLAVNSDNPAMGHAITLWGVQYDDSNTLTKIWFTDSDDEKTQLCERTITLKVITQEGENGQQEKINRYYFEEETPKDNHVYIAAVFYIDPSESAQWGAIPEPGTATLSLLALAALAARRRR